MASSSKAIGRCGSRFGQCNAQFAFVSMILIYFAVAFTYDSAYIIILGVGGDGGGDSVDGVCFRVVLEFSSFGQFACGFGRSHEVFGQSDWNMHKLGRVPLVGTRRLTKCVTQCVRVTIGQTLLN